VSLDALDRHTLPTAIANRLQSLIIEGQLGPGARLNERALCEHLKVSRTPLREAFRLLAADGLVELQPNKGAKVAVLSEKHICESFEIMEGLEALSGELACQRIKDEQVAEIKALTYEMQACYMRHDLPSYYKINRQIHDLISEAAQNTLLAGYYRHVNLRLQNLRYRSNLNPKKWDQAMREHMDMVEALEHRDSRRLAEIMRQHIKRKGEAVLELFRASRFGKAAAES